MQNESEPKFTNKNNIELDYKKESNLNKKRKKVIVSLVATALLTTGTIFGAVGCSNNEKQTNRDPNTESNADSIDTSDDSADTETNTTTDESTEATNETVANPTSEIDYTKPTENVVECYGFETLTPDQQAEIKTMEAMSIQEFQALPETEQLKFSYWVFKNYQPRFEIYLEKNNVKLKKYVEQPTTAQDLSDNYAYLTSFATCLFTTKNESDGSITLMHLDVPTAQKFMAIKDTSSENHNTGNNGYVEEFAGKMIMAEIDMTAEDFKETADGMIINMYEQTGGGLVIPADAEHMQRTFIKTSFTSIEGKEISWQLCSWETGIDGAGYQDISN